VVASPSRPYDADAMLRSCAHAAVHTGALCLFLEPIALYHTRDLYEDGDGQWLSNPSDEADTTIGTARTHGNGADLTIITYANGVPMSLRVAEKLRRTHGIDARVVDLRWLAPLPIEDILCESRATGRVLVADETRRSGGVGQAVLAALIEDGFQGDVMRVASDDSFIPLGDAALHVLLQESTIEQAGLALCRPKQFARTDTVEHHRCSRDTCDQPSVAIGGF
jgi:2-oxoisovalerate dehydrogenase E1 component